MKTPNNRIRRNGGKKTAVPQSGKPESGGPTDGVESHGIDPELELIAADLTESQRLVMGELLAKWSLQLGWAFTIPTSAKSQQQRDRTRDEAFESVRSRHFRMLTELEQIQDRIIAFGQGISAVMDDLSDN